MVESLLHTYVRMHKLAESRDCSAELLHHTACSCDKASNVEPILFLCCLEERVQYKNMALLSRQARRCGNVDANLFICLEPDFLLQVQF
jgi:hypothetical protein